MHSTHFHRHHHHHILHAPHLHGLWGMYLNEFFRRIATSLVGIYIPLFIWHTSHTLSFIPMYYVIFGLVALAFQVPVGFVIKRIGVDRSLFVGSIARIGFIVSLIFAQSHIHFIWLSAVFFGLAQPFEWLPFHYVIAKLSQKNQKYGSAAGGTILMSLLASAISPLVGGMIIAWYGYTWMYIFAGCFCIVSGLVPFFDDYRAYGMHISRKKINTLLHTGTSRKLFTSFFLWLWGDMTYLMIWPVYLYAVMKTFELTGFIQTISILGSGLVILIVSKQVDQKHFKMIKFGSVVSILSWLFRIVVAHPVVLSLAEVLYNISGNMIWTPINALFYAHSAKRYTLDYWLMHEMMWYATIAAISFGILLLIEAGLSVYWLMVVATGVSLGTSLLYSLYQRYIQDIQST